MGENPSPEPAPVVLTLLGHAVAMAALLALLAPFSRPVELWTADEGAIRLQVEALVENGEWALPRPLPELDPGTVTVPIHDAVVDGDFFYPFTKQPASPVVMAPFQAAFGRAWAIAPAIVSVVVAAFLTGLIGARWSRTVAVASLWVTGVATPMFLYGFTVLGHTAGAAIVAGCALTVVVACEGRARLWPVAVGLAAVGPLLRTEAAIAAVALGAAVAVTAIRDRRRVGWGLAIGGSGIAGLALNVAAQLGLAGSTVTTVAGGEAGFFERVVTGIYDSVLRADAVRSGAGIALFLAASLAGLLAFAMRRDPGRTVLHIVLAVAAAVAAVAAWRLGSPVVWGLLIAAPLLVFGLVSLPREIAAADPGRLLLLAAALGALGVFVTQVEGAGGHQWGGRYLMVLLPFLIPVAAAAAIRLLAAASPPSRVAATVTLLVLALVCTGLSWRALRDNRLASSLLSETIGEALVDAGDAGDGAGPVLVSPVVQIGRQGWRFVMENRFVMVPRDEYPDYVGRLGGSELETIAVVDLEDSEDGSLFTRAGFGLEPGPDSPIPLLEFAIARR